jgi:ABC-type lipoprotein export system ATPase subunit
MIHLNSITKVYGADPKAKPAVADVTLQISDGEFVVITGRSGSGKTTLLNIMAGLTNATSGDVLYDGVDVWRLPDRQQSLFRNQNVGYVFQFPSLMPSLTVLENVLLPTSFFPNEESVAERTGRALALLGRVGLQDKAAAYPRQLSAGQQQRVVIARSLINRPCVLFADEPTSDLDEQTEQEIMGLFKQIHREMGMTVILVTHSFELTTFGTRALRMTAGKLAEPAPGEVRA